MSTQKLNSMLKELNVQYKVGGQWVLYKDHQEEGYTSSDTFYDQSGNVRLNTKWTQKGRLFIYNLLKKEKDILPLIEKSELKHGFGESRHLNIVK